MPKIKPLDSKPSTASNSTPSNISWILSMDSFNPSASRRIPVISRKWYLAPENQEYWLHNLQFFSFVFPPLFIFYSLPECIRDHKQHYQMHRIEKIKCILYLFAWIAFSSIIKCNWKQCKKIHIFQSCSYNKVQIFQVPQILRESSEKLPVCMA